MVAASNTPYPPIPYGMANFATIRREGYLYVDKTRFVRALENERYAFFLRPRRFGKTCWLSMLAHYYDRTRQDGFEAMFAGTDIGRELKCDGSCRVPSSTLAGNPNRVEVQVDMKVNGATKTIVIAQDFSKFPAGRFRCDSESSGTAFRDDLLVDALNSNDGVEVVFDGVAGFASSFLEEAFGGLVRECHLDKAFLDEHLRLRTSDPDLADFVKLAERYIKEADQTVNP